jgi:hypothetical protein
VRVSDLPFASESWANIHTELTQASSKHNTSFFMVLSFSSNELKFDVSAARAGCKQLL